MFSKKTNEQKIFKPLIFRKNEILIFYMLCVRTLKIKIFSVFAHNIKKFFLLLHNFLIKNRLRLIRIIGYTTILYVLY